MARKAEYGRGHPKFLQYVDFIVHHPEYKNMPDAVMEDGTVQWEAPSNRTGGKFKDTHHKRREWWRKKAVTAGVNPKSEHWIRNSSLLFYQKMALPMKN